MTKRLLALVAVLALLLALPVFAQETDDPTDGFDDEGGMSLEEISRMLDNPVGNLWIIFMENQVARFKGRPADGWETVNTLIVQPILPVGLTEDWNLITRPIIPIVSAPKFQIPGFGDCPGNCNTPPSNPAALLASNISASRRTALGDIMFWAMLSPAEPRELSDGSKFLWGLGPAARFPTAREKQFGSERYAVGPSSILMRLPAKDGKRTLGLFQQHHIWSFGGNDNRDRVKTSQIQYIWWYKLPTKGEWSVGAAPMIDVNWYADDSDKWSVPIGIGASNTFFLGPMPVRLGFEFNYFVISPSSYGKKFMFKVYLVPVIPRLVKKPIFGSD